MTLELFTTTAFERDLRRARKQGKDLDKLEAVVDLLQAQQQLSVLLCLCSVLCELSSSVIPAILKA